jgi:hypothetical protein
MYAHSNDRGFLSTLGWILAFSETFLFLDDVWSK